MFHLLAGSTRRFSSPELVLLLCPLTPPHMTAVRLRSSEGVPRTVIAASFRQLWDAANLLHGQGTLELPDGTLIADDQ